MTSILTQFVVDNVWCTPGQDKELSITPRSLHGHDSVFGRLDYLGRKIDLPSFSKSWYVYQIGTYYEDPDQLPLYQYVWQSEVWRPLSEPLKEDNVITTLFTDKGVVFPLFRSYYMYTNEKALLIAVEKNSLIPADLSIEKLYVNFYINAFYDSIRSDGIDYSLKSDGMVLTNVSDINSINSTINSLTAESGYCWLTINGRRFKKPDDSFVSAGDYVEYIYDPTVEKVDQYPLSSLLNYYSTLDSEDKTLFHSQLSDYFTTIQYQDDLVIDLYTKISDTTWFGFLYPTPDIPSLRMLTHRDYGMRSSIVDTITDIITTLNPSALSTDVVVEVKFRKSGYQRTLRKTTSLIDDLYTLPTETIPNVLTQNPVTFSTFSANWLETSPYVQAMTAIDKDDFTNELAIDVIGYNGTAKAYGYAATKVTIADGIKSVEIPDNYKEACTAYEYNISGQYLEFHTSESSSTYVATHVNCNIVELLKGLSSNQPAAEYGNDHLTYTPGCGHRVYACTTISGVPQYDWSDITDTIEYIVDTNTNLISFSNSSDTRYMMVRNDSKFVTANISRIFTTNFMSFQLTEQVNRGQGAGFENIPMEVPTSDIEIFMNTRSLVRNVDYFIEFPNVYITNVEYINQPVDSATQLFHWRTTGLGSGVDEFEPLLDHGNIYHGFVGSSGRYVPKNDKNIRVTVDGYIKIPSTVKFAQDYLTGSDPDNPTNGLLYQVQSYNVPVSDIIDTNQEQIRKLSRERDDDLLAFMDNNFVFPDRGSQTVVTSYHLVCPFHAKILDDLIAGVFTTGQLDPTNSDAEVQSAVASYLHLLDAGPCNPIYGLTENSIYDISPSARINAIHLGDVDKLTFFTRVSNLYTPGIVNLGSIQV